MAIGRVIEQTLNNRCPQCGKAPVFSGLVKMNSRCPSCRYVYAREPGYFIGAMVFSYIFGSFSIVPTVVIGSFLLNYEISTVIAIATLQLCLISPLLFRFSRLFWIFLDFRADPARPT